MASQTGAHSVPGEDKMYSTPSLRNASTMAVPPSNWFFMVGLLERFSCGVYYLTPERARPWRANNRNSGEARSRNPGGSNLYDRSVNPTSCPPPPPPRECVAIVISSPRREIFSSHVAENVRSLAPLEMTSMGHSCIVTQPPTPGED